MKDTVHEGGCINCSSQIQTAHGCPQSLGGGSREGRGWDKYEE